MMSDNSDVNWTNVDKNSSFLSNYGSGKCHVTLSEVHTFRGFASGFGHGCVLYNARIDCKHVVETMPSGIKCKHCSGWYCA